MLPLNTLKRAMPVAIVAPVSLSLMSGEAYAEVNSETAYILNTFSFLIHGVLVMFMAAGFAMLESGLVRSKNTATICLKNIALYSIAGIVFYLVGYDLMYTGVDKGFIGTLSFMYNPGDAELALLGAKEVTAEQLKAVTDAGYSVSSDWFFQMVFVATAASVVSGTVAERIKVWPFLIFVVVLSAVIYPVQASWVWGGGWLNELGFVDFAGSTLVHSVGGWCALTGAIILGARKGKYTADGKVNPIPGANMPLATLGTFVLWFGWFGFNGGSQLALGSVADATAMSIVYVNTNIGAAGGVVAAMVLTQLFYKKVDLSIALNGALAGLVAITAGPDLTNHATSMIIGALGGALVVISVHLVAGIWGTLCVGIFGVGTVSTQLIGIVSIGAFVVVASSIVWVILKATVGIRIDEEDEANGSDMAECGMEAYPEFGRGSQSF